jgi:hypothetical protein
MQMRADPKYAGQLPIAYDNSDLVSNQGLVKNTVVQFILKNIFIFDFGFISGSTSAYVRPGSPSSSASGSESIISPIINFNYESVSFNMIYFIIDN